MKNHAKLLFLAGVGLLLSGCIASERDMGTLKLQLRELNDTITLMQSNQAELASKMEELNQNLSVSNENFSQLDSQMLRLTTKLDDLSAVVKQPSAVHSAAAAEGAAPERPAAAAAMLPSDLFNESKNHLNKESYELAVTGFKLYLDKYPDGENVQQAYIYLGDAYAGLGQGRNAAIQYATVLQKFPESKIIPTARLKYARSIVPLGKTEEAKRYFNSVVQDFPKSPEAKLAKEEAAKLK